MLVFAHSGHWLVQLLYAMPLLALGVAVVVTKRQERREDRDAAQDGEATSRDEAELVDATEVPPGDTT